MKVVLRYKDCLQDGRNVFNVLAIRNVEILKTKQGLFSDYPNITIHIKDYNTLNQVLSDLNKVCIYGVRVIKVKSEESFFGKIKKWFK